MSQAEEKQAGGAAFRRGGQALWTALIAIGAPVLALLWRQAMLRYLGHELPPYFTFYPAVMLVAMCLGFWPGALATATAALLAAYWIIPPQGFAIGHTAEAVALATFSVVGIFMSVVAELYRRNRQKAEAYERQETLRASEEHNRAMVRDAEERRKVGEAVQVERQRLINVLNMLPAYVVLLSPDYHVPFANPYFEEHFGKSEGRRCYEYLFQRTAPCENCESYKVFQTGAPHHWEWLGPNGRYYTIHDMPFTDIDGSSLIMELGIDITERKEAEERLGYLNRSLRALSDCNQLLLHSADEQSLLNGVCRILVEHCGHALAWVGYPEQDEAKSVRIMAAEGAAKDYLMPGLVTWADEERGRGPTGTAIRAGRAVVLDDASTDPSFAPWREGAVSREFHSCVCLPVPIGESLPAGLTIYSTQRGAFHGEELQLLEELAQDLGYGVRMLRMRGQRDRAEERARQLALIVECSEDAIYSKDLDGTILTWNHGAEKMYGYAAEEIVGQPVGRLQSPDSEGEIAWVLERVGCGETVEHFETSRMRKDGTRCEVSITVSPIHDSEGRIVGAASVARDITGRKQAERRLEDQQFYTRSLIEASLDPLVTISREGKITDVNQATESVTGATREELIGTDFSDYFTEPEKARAGYEQVFAEGFVQDYPLAVRHSSGRLTEVLYNATVFRNEQGEVAGVFAAARDITARKQAERRLAEQQFYTRSLIEASLDPLVTISREGKITDVNQATESVTGATREELIGTDFSDYFTEPDKARAGYQQVFTDGFVQDYPLAIRHTSSQLTDVLYNATVFRNQKGEVAGVFAAARDITARKRAEQEAQRYMQELERSNAELQDFASIASHDLQEPLRKVLAFGDHLKEHCEDSLDELGRDFLARMQNAAHRMSALIEALLEYSRVTTRAQPLQPVDLTQLMFEVLVDMEERISRSHAQVEFMPLPKVMADPMQVRQLLQNLLANSLKFQAAGTTPQILVEGRRQNGWCEITVQDNGIGFDEKYTDRIFRPFQRLHGRNEYEGSGMGLAICRKVVARYGGQITVHSRPGQGSTFVLTLPGCAHERTGSP